MIKNIWNKVTFFCMNHEEPLPFYEYRTEKETFYACHKYMKKDEDHPDGHEENEPACFNRLSFTTAADIVSRFASIMEEDSLMGTQADYKGMRFIVKNIEVKVLRYTPSEIRFGIINRSVFR